MEKTTEDLSTRNNSIHTEVVVGHRLRFLRMKHGYSLRGLAEQSGLNINTLSLIEKGKTSPSVSTLQQLAQALDEPITSFFGSEPVEKRIVFTSAEKRPRSEFGKTEMQNLGRDLSGSAVQPFVVNLQPGMTSGDRMIVHTGYEFVYGLSGSIHYQIDQENFIVNPNDSLVFEAHLPHCWENTGSQVASILLILFPEDEREAPAVRHFSSAYMKKEIDMKIAVITDDGTTISQHFGRAGHYMVLTIEEGKIVNREMRDKMGHNQFNSEPHEEHSHDCGHGNDGASHGKHVSMAEAIADCKVLLCGGMGMGAYQSMLQLKIQPVVTDMSDIEEAAQAVIDGKLVDHTELLH